MTETGQRRIVGELTFEQKIALLREKWGKHIGRPYVQIKMLEELMRHCQKEQPNDWVACVNELAGAAFPQLAGKLFEQLSSLVKYNDWLTNNKDRLDKMDRKERRKLLTEMRNSLFGEDDANDIWAAETKAENLRIAIEELKDIKGKDIATKLAHFKNALNENYGAEARAYLERHQQEIANSLLNSVQSDLKALTPTQQKHALRTIRSELGMDAAAIERWDALDNERENRWKTGKEYLAEREKLLKNPSGDTTEALNELRKKYFGAEADSIAAEEAEGYLRFQGEQRIGID
jgi:Fe-S cluster biosynthesis and repair protein YggX